MTRHVCTCGDCAVEPFEDRCKYERAVMLLRAGARDIAEGDYADTGARRMARQMLADTAELEPR